MKKEELQKLDERKKECIYWAYEVQRVVRVLEEFKDVDYVMEILKRNFTELREEIENIHNKMFNTPNQ